eukprot:gene2005-2467_t
MTRKYTRKASTAAATTTTETSTASTSSKKRKNVDEKVQPILKKTSTPLSNILMLFEKYKDEDDFIGPDGMIRFCNDLGFSPDSIEVLILAWQLGADKMEYFTKEEFIAGLEKLKCYDLEALKKELLTQRYLIKTDQAKFSELYKFSFGFASDNEKKRSVDFETASEMLKLILPDGPHTSNFVLFLQSHPASCKVLNKDQWVCFLEFSKSVKSDLSNYDESEAWPLLFDTFVEYVKKNKEGGNK